MEHDSLLSMAGVGPEDVEEGWRLLAALPLGLLVIGYDGVVRLVNKEGARIVGVNAAKIVGRPWHHWLKNPNTENGRPADGISLDENGAREVLGVGVAWRCRVTRCDGTQSVVEISRIDRCPEWPASWEIVLWLRDCTAQDEQIRRLRRLSETDHLTNLVNRWEFERRLEKALERTKRDGARHVLMFMDLDHFKQVNDRFGHPAGDSVLRQVAETMRLIVRERDTLGRLGGDEFGLLMEHCDLEEGRRAAVTLGRQLRGQCFCWGAEQMHLEISVGLVAVDERSADLVTVWQQADAACYRAKQRLAVMA